MFEVIYMKADYEPWWMFEGWEEAICSRRSFDDAEHAKNYFEKLLTRFREKYECEAMKKNCFYAFWSEHEKQFCDGCDENLQLYHGVFLMKDGKPEVHDTV